MMTKKQFMARLERALSPLSAEVRKEILADYEEHFAQGLREGLSEDEICRRLGDPETIAADYIPEEARTGSKQAQSGARPAPEPPPAPKAGRQWSFFAGLLTALALAALNLLVMIPVFAALFSVVLVLFLLALIAVAAFAVLLFALPTLGLTFVCAGLLCAALLFLFGTIKLMQLCFRGAFRYIRANFRLIREGKL